MEYITVKGDTFDIIAYKVYGNEELIKPIIEANPEHTETVIFDYGIKMTIPDIYSSNNDIFLPPWRK